MQNDEMKLHPEAFDAAIRALLPDGWSSAWGEESHDWMRARGYANTAIRTYLSALSAIPSTGSGETKSNYPEIPDGWKLVPVEPTDEQIAAGLESLASSTGEPILHIVRDALFAYRSMVRTSPANPAETQAVEVGK